jgi:Sulfotransferase family
MPPKQKVVYVMGSGHSGSTILGVTLGNCEGVCYAGELDNWLTRSGVSVLGGLERTRFWDDVRARVEGSEELFGSRAQRSLERSSAAVRPDRWAEARALRPRYRRVTQRLFEAIAEVSGCSYVVDTSHFPLRARELKALPGLDVYLVFLVRDPEQVVGSFTRFMNRNASGDRLARVVSKNLDIWLTHLLCLPVFLRTPRERRLLLRHEDFLEDPERVLGELLAFIDSRAPLPPLDKLRTGFPIQANRLIQHETVSLQSKPHARPAWTLTRLLQLPWELIFSRLSPRVEHR